MSRIGIGVIGCGVISDVYIRNLTTVFQDTRVVAVADMDIEKARARAEQYGVPRVCESAEELLSLPQVSIALILTQPKSHASLAKAALLAGKHAYVEKPFALTRADARELLDLANARALCLSSAPDTVLGAVVQTGAKLIADGWIGDVIGASMSSSFGAPETWHPNPDFLYQKGAGPLYDNGPYAIWALIYLLGPVVGVDCAARRTYAYRTITSQPRYGEKIAVEVPTFLQTLLTFQSGASATVMFSCDTCNEKLQETGLEVYGSQGTLVLSHPSKYGGRVWLKRRGMRNWREMPLINGYDSNSRGLGVADMARALADTREMRLSGDFIYHGLDVFIGIDEAGEAGNRIGIASTFRKTQPLPIGAAGGELHAPDGM